MLLAYNFLDRKTHLQQLFAVQEISRSKKGKGGLTDSVKEARRFSRQTNRAKLGRLNTGCGQSNFGNPKGSKTLQTKDNGHTKRKAQELESGKCERCAGRKLPFLGGNTPVNSCLRKTNVPKAMACFSQMPFATMSPL